MRITCASRWLRQSRCCLPTTRQRGAPLRGRKLCKAANLEHRVVAVGRCIVVGDFNIDLIQHPHHSILSCMSKFRQCIASPTTDHGSLLDHLYTNISPNKVQAGVLESYFSDHKALYFSTHWLELEKTLVLFWYSRDAQNIMVSCKSRPFTFGLQYA